MHFDKDNTFKTELINALETNDHLSSWPLFKMAYEAELLTHAPSFKGLRSLEYLPHMNFLSHQVETAIKAIEEMNGRAILADEVGLGKTIEAGLILKEYLIRGLVKKVLILVPASLVSQWVSELNEKFLIPAIAYRKNYHWNDIDIIVSSIDTAKRGNHEKEILEIDYDLLLIDEAHKLKNEKTKNFQLVQSIKKKYCLLLTATPIQNRLMEIFNLVSILKPGHLGSNEAFVNQYGDKKSKLHNDQILKELIRKVMIRNTRKETTVQVSKRNIETIWLDFSPEERALYQTLTEITSTLPSFVKITYLREICSSRESLYLTLDKASQTNEQKNLFAPLIKMIENLPQHTKAKKLVELIQNIGDEKIIIFTEYRATQLYLQWFLQQHGISSVPFRGGFKAGKKDWMKQLFRDKVQVLIATEAAGEGINLQFCNHLINYDLPWNPMRLEQRIGRIHRYGQTKDVFIYNLAIRNTIEEHMMKLLYGKIELFENVIGELDDILDELQIEDLGNEVQRIFSESTTDGELAIKLNNLTAIIEQSSFQKEKEA